MAGEGSIDPISSYCVEDLEVRVLALGLGKDVIVLSGDDENTASARAFPPQPSLLPIMNGSSCLLPLWGKASSANEGTLLTCTMAEIIINCLHVY